MNYPSKSDLIDMSLWSLGEHLKELQSKAPQMTAEQRQAFLRICQGIAGATQRNAA